MDQLSDSEFFSKLAVYLDDVPAEALTMQGPVIKRLQDSLMSVEIAINLQAISVIRMWNRKLAARIQLDVDNRLKIIDESNNENKFQNSVKRFCLGFAELCAALFSKPDVLPFAVLACKELLEIGGIVPSDIIIESAKRQLSNEAQLIPLLEIITRSEKEIDGLPIIDPKLVYKYPDLYKKALNISPESRKDVAKHIFETTNQIKAFIRGEGDINKNLLRFAANYEIIDHIDPNFILTNDDNELRLSYFKRISDTPFDILPYLSAFLKISIFDPVVQEYALKIIENNIESLRNQIPGEYLVYLQCMKAEPDSSLYNFVIDTINNHSDYDLIAGWARFLFHKDKVVRQKANSALSEILKTQINIDTQMKGDPLTKEFRDALMRPGTLIESTKAQSFVDVITSGSHQQFVKSAAASQLALILIDPYTVTKGIYPQIKDLPFAEYGRLLHALSIRDNSSVIVGDVDRLVELITSIKVGNEFDYVPILARTLFKDISFKESDNSDLLRLPEYINDNFDVQCAIGTYKPVLYEKLDPVLYEREIKEWIDYRYVPLKPIKKGINFGVVVSLIVNDDLLANDFLTQLEEDPYALDVLFSQNKPHFIGYLLLLTCQSAGRATKNVSIACQKLMNDAPDMGLKLAQTILELGGDIDTPSNLTDYILDEKTRRAAVSLLLVLVQHKKDTSSVNYDELIKLFAEKLPINIMRQLSTIFASRGRSPVGDDILISKDGITRCMGFRVAELTEQNFNAAADCVVNDHEAVCTRAAAVEFINEYFYQNGYHEIPLSLLFYRMKGENPLAFELLRLLSNPEVRTKVQDYETIVTPFLQAEEDSNPFFVKAAMFSLIGHPIQSDEIFAALTYLLDDNRFTNDVLNVITTMDNETLSKFTPEVIFRITDALAYEIDIKLALCAVNRCLLAGIEFPYQSAQHILDLYQQFIKSRCSLVEIHVVMAQMFHCSDSARQVALESNFVNLALEEIQHANDLMAPYILDSCSSFVYEFTAGQNQLALRWGSKFLSELFSSDDTVIQFFLCLVKKNEKTQELFRDRINGTSLLEVLQQMIDENDTNSELLLELFSNILNSSRVRKQVFVKRAQMQNYIEKIQGYSTDRNVEMLEAWLRVFITITIYADGLSSLYGTGMVSDLLMHFFRSGDEIRNNKIFLIFLRNLIRDRTHREGLKAKIIQECIRNDEEYLVEIFNSLIEAITSL